MSDITYWSLYHLGYKRLLMLYSTAHTLKQNNMILKVIFFTLYALKSITTKGILFTRAIQMYWTYREQQKKNNNINKKP